MIVNYDPKSFIVQATGVNIMMKFCCTYSGPFLYNGKIMYISETVQLTKSMIKYTLPWIGSKSVSQSWTILYIGKTMHINETDQLNKKVLQTLFIGLIVGVVVSG